MSFETSADDIRKVLQLNPDESDDVSLSDYVELYQLMSLEKAITEASKSDGSIGSYAQGLVEQQVQFLKLGLKELADNTELQKEYGTGLTGAKKLAKALHNAHREMAAKTILTDAVEKSGIVKQLKKSAFNRPSSSES